MAELVYAFDLKSNGEIHMGSSPISGTMVLEYNLLVNANRVGGFAALVQVSLIEAPDMVLFCCYICDSEFYFVRSGMIYLSYGSLRDLNFTGYGWPNIAKGYSSAISANAYYLRFNSSIVRPSDNYHRYFGFPVRCLVY